VSELARIEFADDVKQLALAACPFQQGTAGVGVLARRPCWKRGGRSWGLRRHAPIIGLFGSLQNSFAARDRVIVKNHLAPLSSDLRASGASPAIPPPCGKRRARDPRQHPISRSIHAVTSEVQTWDCGKFGAYAFSAHHQSPSAEAVRKNAPT
jgi:hypothetical protein